MRESVLALALPAVPALATVPTDNPIATRYGTSDYSWTHEIKWSNVVNINDYLSAGSTMVEHF
jgi:hypothetical protein